MIKINVESSDVWGYASRNRSDLLENEHLIAENPDFGIAIYVTVDSYYPVVKIYAEDMLINEEEVFSSFTCAIAVEQMYDSYLTTYTTHSSDFSKKDEDSNSEDVDEIEENEDEIEENEDEIELIEDRELELDIAIEDFFRAISADEDLDLSGDAAKEIMDDCKDHFLEYIARKHGLKIYRPMYLEYDTGVEFELFPYENMAFEDESNPIYK